MYTAASYIQHPYPSFLSYTRNHHYLNNSTFYSPNLDLSSPKQIQSDNEDDNQSLSPSFGDTTNEISLKKRSRTIPAEEKDAVYYEKRARNNESAKRSRDIRRIKEEQIQERVNFLEHENSRLLMENQAILYQISQLHALCSGVSKPLQ
jgi:hypothetical protein